MHTNSLAPTRPFKRCLLAVLALSCVLAPNAPAASAPLSDGNLSPRLAQLTAPALRSTPLAQVGKRLSLPSQGPGSLLREGNRVVVEVRFESGAAAAVDALRAAGADIIQVSPSYQTVTVAAKPAELRAIGALARVAGVTEVLAPIARGAVCGGSVTSEGDQQLNAAGARTNFGVDGSGVTVGILSDSFNRSASAVTHAPGDVASGDLPGPGSPCGSSSPVNILDDNQLQGEDEGRAMIQIVHDLAPGASIDFASASGGTLSFAANIKALANAGATVIADDIGYLDEPFFQDGPVAQAVNEVTARGVSYLSAAGNDNQIDEGRNIASWEAPQYRDGGLCPAEITVLSQAIEKEERDEGNTAPDGLNPNHCMDFNPGAASDNTFGIVVEEGATLTVDLQWAEPWFGVSTDLDAFLLDNEGVLKEMEGSPVISTNANGDTQKPFELFSWENTDSEQEVQLVINRFAGDEPAVKFALQGGNGVTETEYEDSAQGDVVGPLVFGQPGAASAIGVAAVPYNDSTKPEKFSSPGPVTHYFGPVVGTTPAAPIAPQRISKPDVAATDGGVTTFFSELQTSGVWRFFGTSAATPHATAVVALMRQANPGASGAQLRAALGQTARPVGAFGPDVVGGGLIDAFAAVKSVALPPKITITKAPPAFSRDRRPAFEFVANRPAALKCAFGGGAPAPCSSPFTVPSSLSDGAYSFTVAGVDVAGREGSSRVAFTIDTKAPRTSIVKHPRKFVVTHHRKFRGRFSFRSNEQGVKFSCSIDRGRFRQCSAKFAHTFRAGRHVIKVRAEDPAGNVGKPAVFGFSAA